MRPRVRSGRQSEQVSNGLGEGKKALKRIVESPFSRVTVDLPSGSEQELCEFSAPFSLKFVVRLYAVWPFTGLVERA